MLKVLAEAELVKIGNTYQTLKVVQADCSGGSRVDYVDSDGKVVKSEAYSRSKYGRANKEEK